MIPEDAASLESEANYFAMCLLIPETMLKREIKAMGGIDLADDAQLKQLARKFQVPQGLMALRVHQVFKRELW